MWIFLLIFCIVLLIALSNVYVSACFNGEGLCGFIRVFVFKIAFPKKKNEKTEKKSEPTPEQRTEQYYKKRPCAEMVKMAAKIMEQYIRENPIKVKSAIKSFRSFVWLSGINSSTTT